jgi:hypothetical protein
VEWAAVALETSSNQPVLPHAIIALNASENSIDPELWDTDVATERLLESLSQTVRQNECFRKHSQIWAGRNKQIKTVKQLMLSYYSSLRVGVYMLSLYSPSLSSPLSVGREDNKLGQNLANNISLNLDCTNPRRRPA